MKKINTVLIKAVLRLALLVLAANALCGCSTDRAMTIEELASGDVESEEPGATGSFGISDAAESGANSSGGSVTSAPGANISGGSATSASGPDVALNGLDPSGNVTDTSSMPVTVFVYVCGCVESPGVYELPAESRICDALEAAGGFLEGADENRINLAAGVRDGEMIFFPKDGEEIPEGAYDGMSCNAADPAQQGYGAFQANASSQANASQQSVSSQPGPVNINTANAETLCTLPGIGEAKALAIIRYREEHGSFSDISQIRNVPGIGENLYSNISGLICI